VEGLAEEMAIGTTVPRGSLNTTPQQVFLQEEAACKLDAPIQQAQFKFENPI
jgi:hypothetical protein